ncbi:unnamed protein product [Trypanosoma congolense IL3000]|uniref:WGS project CAEQ00000000 data, annotated contig 1894 n=1 Tax=Trypanosoma congolense (strain IL3000) TaxID=1068625 RepID=F9W9T3_TRYCI|nr:unnamed protein product [Trypanosoma congolense IL3000]
MPSCERVAPNQFHSNESRLYTDRCVKELTHSRAFRDYVNHLEYNERIQLMWFVVPIGLTLAIYYHIFFLFPGGCSAKETGAEFSAPLHPLAATLLTLFVLPSTVIAQISGFFEPVPEREVFKLIAYLTFVNISVVSFGGSWTHHPPYIVSHPPVQWLTGTTAQLGEVLWTTTFRALPLQGVVVSTLLVHSWHNRGWRRAWVLPQPLLAVPIIFAFVAWLWYRLASPVCMFLLSATSGSGTEAGVDDVISQIGGLMVKEILLSFSYPPQPNIFSDSLDCCHIWSSALTLSLLYFAGVLVIPIAKSLAGATSWLLPTHPTTWGLLFASCVATFFALIQRDNSSIMLLVALVVIMWSLGRNGFSVSG